MFVIVGGAKISFTKIVNMLKWILPDPICCVFQSVFGCMHTRKLIKILKKTISRSFFDFSHKMEKKTLKSVLLALDSLLLKAVCQFSAFLVTKLD